MSLRCLIAAAFMLVGIAASPVQAVTVWTDEVAFNAFTGGLPTYGFPAADAEKEIEFVYNRKPVFFGGEDLQIIDDGGFGAGVPYLGSHADLAALFLGGTGIGFHVGSYYGPTEIDIEINGWYVTTLSTLADRQISFIGFTGLDPFLTAIRFSGPCSCGGGEPAFEAKAVDEFEFDVIDFSTDGTSFVPEPVTWTLMLAGFGAIGLVSRRRRTAIAA